MAKWRDIASSVNDASQSPCNGVRKTGHTSQEEEEKKHKNEDAWMLWMLWIQTRAHRIHVVRKIVFHHICCLCLVCRLHWRFIDPNPAKFSSISPALLILLLFAWHKVLYYFYWCFLYDICRYAVERTAYTLGASPNKTMSHVFYGRRQELVRLRDSWFVNAGVARFFFTLVDLFLNLRYFMQFEAFKWKSFHFCFDLYLSFIFSEKRFPCLSSFCRQQRSKKRNISRAGVRMSRVLCEHRFSLSIVICSIFFLPFYICLRVSFFHVSTLYTIVDALRYSWRCPKLQTIGL